MECGTLEQKSDNKFQKKVWLYTSLFRNQKLHQSIQTELYIRMSLIVFALIPLTANIFAIIVLHRPDMKRTQPTFRHHLVLLTLSEILYCSTYTLFLIFDVLLTKMAFIYDSAHAFAYVLCVLLGLYEASFVMRNWMVVAISSARCEAITRPLSSLKKRFITSRRARIFAVFIFATALMLAMFNCFSQFWKIDCYTIKYHYFQVGNKTYVRSRYHHFPSVLSRTRMQVKKTYSRGLPIVGVIMTTIIMVVSILRQKSGLSQNQSNMKSATITLIGFTVLFVIIEGVGYLYYLMRTIIRDPGLSTAAWTALFGLDKYLLVFNSMTNVVAYVAFNKTFRAAAWNLVRWTKQKPISSCYPNRNSRSTQLSQSGSV